MSLVVPNNILYFHICDLLSQGKTVAFEAKGYSMLPFIVGDRDSVQLTQAWWGVGDAVLAKLPSGAYVLHRVYKIDGDVVTLKGDGNLKGVELCHVSDVKGKLVAVLRSGTRRVDVDTKSYRRRVRIWNATPYIVRRVILGILRRVIKKK